MGKSIKKYPKNRQKHAKSISNRKKLPNSASRTSQTSQTSQKLATAANRPEPTENKSRPTENRPESAKNQPRSTENRSHSTSRSSAPTWLLLTILVVVLGGSFFFITSIANQARPDTVTLDPDYYASTSTLENQDGDFLELLTPDRYNELIDQQKSFVLFVDQTNCVNADRMRQYLADYIAETGLKPYRIMFSDLKETSLHDTIKYYPTTVVFSQGQPIAYLDANSDDHTDEFNDYTAFKTWLDSILTQS